MFDNNILQAIQSLDAAIKTFEKELTRLTAEERRLLAQIKTVREQLALKLAPR